MTGVARLNTYTLIIMTGWRRYRGTIIRFTFFVDGNRPIWIHGVLSGHKPTFAAIRQWNHYRTIFVHVM